mgnify:CR=1 FL=1
MGNLRRRTYSANSDVSEHFYDINEREVEDITLELFYKPHTITALSISLLARVYSAFTRYVIRVLTRTVNISCCTRFFFVFPLRFRRIVVRKRTNLSSLLMSTRWCKSWCTHVVVHDLFTRKDTSITFVVKLSCSYSYNFNIATLRSGRILRVDHPVNVINAMLMVMYLWRVAYSLPVMHMVYGENNCKSDSLTLLMIRWSGNLSRAKYLQNPSFVSSLHDLLHSWWHSLQMGR